MYFFSELKSGSCSSRHPVQELVEKSFLALDSMMNSYGK